MINWTFYINDTEVEEPQGWSDVVLNISRDDNWHGIFFEASTSTLIFYGAGADLLITERETNGLAATANFRVEADCGQTVDILEGSFDFGTYSKKCGNTCGVEIAIEKTGCTMTLRNRYDQKVDLQDTKAFDKQTLLNPYPYLDFSVEMLPQVLSLGNEAEMQPTPMTDIVSDNVNWSDSTGFNDYQGYMCPPLPVITNASLGTFNASPIIDICGPLASASNRPPYPDFPTTSATTELVGSITCGLEDVSAQFRIKGSASVTVTGGVPVPSLGLSVVIFRLPAGLDGTVAANWIEEYDVNIVNINSSATQNFDLAATIALTVSQGDFIWFGLRCACSLINKVSNFTVTFDPETFYKLMASSECETTDADVAMVNEVGSRIVEAITDECLTMKSDYYGRTDSEPYASSTDGCGSLRVLTNGLKLRNATTDNHFISMREYFEGLRGIDNIGMGIEDNTVIAGKQWVRIEPVKYFYQDVKLLTLPYIPNATSKLEPTMGYSGVKIGYQQWEVERVNGLNEFNSNKEFRTSLKTINNILDATSAFVAGGIPIEVTRQQSFAVSGAADTKYDDSTFIVCVERGGYDFIVEKGNIDNSANIFSPTTAYNWRIRPMYNLMRWFKSIAQSYVNLVNSTSRIFFASGTGNYIAEGELPVSDMCRLETGVLPENNDLGISAFADPDDRTPLWKPETIQFTYPLSIADYLAIKANPYGYIEFQCGTGTTERGFIKTIAYKPVKGEATFTLIKKWQ